MKCNFKLKNELANPLNFDYKHCYNQNDYEFSVDWLNLVLNTDDISSVLLTIANVLEIDISSFESRPSGGVCFYSNAYYIPACGHSSFTINYSLDENHHIITDGEKGQTKGILISISGDGCRWISAHGKTKFVDLCVALNKFSLKCSRIDIACDIFQKDNLLVPMIQDFASTAYRPDLARYDLNCGLNRKDTEGDFRQWVDLKPVFDKVIGDFTTNVTVGGRDCKKGTLQLYNKRVEIETGRLKQFAKEIKDSVGCTDYWWRLEYRCKSFAQSIFDYLINEQNIFGAFLLAAESFGTFVITDNDKISRCTVAVEWQTFLYFIEKLVGSKLFILSNSKSFVNTPYVLSELQKVKRYHNDIIPTSDSAHWFRMCIDLEYRKHFIYKYCQELLFNPKMAKFKDEMRMEYGLKLEEFANLIYGQMSVFD